MSLKIQNNPKLFVNIFPSEEFDWDCLKIDIDRKLLYVRHLFEFHSSLQIKTIPKFWCFQTNGIFFNCCQSEIYNTIVDQIIEQIYLGLDHVVISYGQTYSGKTFAMSGLYNQFELRGIIPRFIVDLFTHQQTKQDDFDSRIWMSVVDIHRNYIYDLLSVQRRLCKTSKEVEKVELKSELHCLELLFKAEARRNVFDQKPYKAHCGSYIVTLTFELHSLNTHIPYNKFSKVHFVDLAGVETIQRNPLTSFKDQQNQGQANVTKTLLEIFALRSQKVNNFKSDQVLVNKRIHIITRYLDSSISPMSYVTLICHIRPHHEDLMITLSLLNFGLTFQGIPMVKPQPHLEPNFERTIENLQEQVKSFQDESIIRNLLDKSFPMKITQDRIDFVKHAVKLFLKGDLSEHDLLSLVDDCSLILSTIIHVQRDKQPPPCDSVALQTDDELNMKSKFSSDIVSANRIEDSPRVSIKKSSDAREKTASLQSPRQVSFKKSKELKKGKEGKAKEGKDKSKERKKSKVEQKPILKSEEVQVNLIEPNSKLPNIDSREGLWATFLISRPDIQTSLDSFTTTVTEKEKQLNSETLKCENVRSSLNKTQLALNQLANVRHFDKEVYDKEGRLVIPNEESNLAKDLRTLQKELNESQQKLTEAQVEWLEALEKLDIAKQVIEQEFKQFCLKNNLLAVKEDPSLEMKPDIRESEVLTSTSSSDVDFQEVYYAMQKKYLLKVYSNGCR